MIERVPLSPCWNCGATLDARMSVGELTERSSEAVGDHCTLCVQCGSISIFRPDGVLREPTPDEEAVLALDPELGKARRILMQFITERKRARKGEK